MRLKRIIQVSISIALLAGLVYLIDINRFFATITDADYIYLIIAIAIVTVNRVIMAYKWNILLKVKNINISLFEATKIYYISNFLGLYLPATIGGDIVRAYYINKDRHKLQDILASIVVERVIGFLVLFCFAVFGGVFYYSYFIGAGMDIQYVLIIIVSISLLALFVFVATLTETISRKVMRIFDKEYALTFTRKIAGKLKGLYQSYYLFRNAKSALLAFCFLTIIEVFSYIIRSYVVAEALGVHIPFAYLFSFVPILMTLIRLPISLNGFGITEGGFVYFLSLIGIPAAIGFSVGLVDHLVVIIAILPGGVFYLYDQWFPNQIKRNELKAMIGK